MAMLFYCDIINPEKESRKIRSEIASLTAKPWDLEDLIVFQLLFEAVNNSFSLDPEITAEDTINKQLSLFINAKNYKRQILLFQELSTYHVTSLLTINYDVLLGLLHYIFHAYAAIELAWYFMYSCFCLLLGSSTSSVSKQL